MATTGLRIILACSVVVLVGLSGSSATTAQRTEKPMQNPDETKLQQLESEWLSCYLSGDKVTYDRIVADDFTGTDESGMFRSKVQDRGLLPPTPVTGASAINEDLKVRVYGDAAVITGRIGTKMKAGDQEIAGFTSRFTDTWLKRQGTWQVVARHYSRIPIEHTAIKVDSRIFDDYAGDYELAPGIVFTVSRDQDKLYGANPNQPKMQLLPESDVVFFLKEIPSLFLFLRDEKGKVSQLLFIQDGRATAAKRKQ